MNRRAVGKMDFPIEDDENAEDDYPDRRQTARVETTTVDVPGAASSMRFAQTCSH